MTTNEPIRVGLKGRVVTIPEGHVRVTEGLVKKGDMYANVYSGKLFEVEWDDLDLPVDTFDCLVRKQNANRTS
jgi:hypothetical protein